MNNVITVDAHVKSIVVTVEHYPPCETRKWPFWIVEQKATDENGGTFAVRFYFNVEPAAWIAFAQTTTAAWVEAISE